MKASKPTAGFSGDTEILTRTDGWVAFSEVRYLDEVATRAPDEEFQWRHVQRVLRESYEGELVAFENKSIRLVVTPGHPLLVRRRFRQRTGHADWYRRSAGDLANLQPFMHELPFVSWWKGSAAPEHFELPGRPSARRLPAHEHATKWLAKRLIQPWTPSGQVIDEAFELGIYEKPLAGARHNLGVTVRRAKAGMGWEMSAPTRLWTPPANRSHMPCRGFKMPMNDFCVFLGLFLAEGWVVEGRTDIMVSQSPKSPDLPEIREILAATGLPFRYEPEHRRFTAHHTVLSQWLGANTGHRAWNKYVPPEFKEYAPPLLGTLLHGMCVGDGEEAPLGQRRYHTTSPRLAADAQEIFQKLGIDAWVKVRDIGRPTKLVPGMNRHRPHTVFERLRAVHLLPPPVRRAYCGNVYSVSVPSHPLVYVRRDGRAVWVPSA